MISTDLEHNSVLRPLYRLREQGGEVDFLPADRQGRIDYGDLARLLRPDTKAVVCTHGSNLTGDLVDIGRVGDFCQKHGLLFILDASQTAGTFPIDMERMHIDVVCFTGHKSLMGSPGHRGPLHPAGGGDPPLRRGGHRRAELLRDPARRVPHPAGGGDPQQPRSGGDWGPLWSIWELSAGRGSAPTRPLWPGNSMKQLKTFPM